MNYHTNSRAYFGAGGRMASFECDWPPDTMHAALVIARPLFRSPDGQSSVANLIGYPIPRPNGFLSKDREQSQAIGRSRGGRNTKIHAIADAKGRLLSILLTGGEVHDCPPAQRLIRRTKPAKKLLGDKAYDSAPLRQWLSNRRTKPVIPNKSNRKQPFRFDRQSYRQRHRVENAFCRLKDFRRIATRYDRLARNFLVNISAFFDCHFSFFFERQPSRLHNDF